MAEDDDTEYDEEEASENLQQLSQIKAVNEAVLRNLEVRSKRDDEKVGAEEKKIKELFDKAWYKNLGGIHQTIQSYMNATTDLNVTHLSIIKQLQEYVRQLNAWAGVFEEAQEHVISLQQLNNNLSLQLKDVDKERNNLKKELERLKGHKEHGSKSRKIAEEDEDVELAV